MIPMKEKENHICIRDKRWIKKKEEMDNIVIWREYKWMRKCWFVGNIEQRLFCFVKKRWNIKKKGLGLGRRVRDSRCVCSCWISHSVSSHSLTLRLTIISSFSFLLFLSFFISRVPFWSRFSFRSETPKSLPWLPSASSRSSRTCRKIHLRPAAQVAFCWYEFVILC